MVSGATVPTGLSFAASLTDPTVREPKNLLETFASRIPGLTQFAPPKLSPFGKPIQRESSFLRRFPLDITSVKHDPIEDELQHQRVFLGMAEPTVGGVKLNDRHAQQFQIIAGKFTRALLAVNIQTPAYQNASDDERRQLLEQTISKARRLVRERFKQEVLQEARR